MIIAGNQFLLLLLTTDCWDCAEQLLDKRWTYSIRLLLNIFLLRSHHQCLVCGGIFDSIWNYIIVHFVYSPWGHLSGESGLILDNNRWDTLRCDGDGRSWLENNCSSIANTRNNWKSWNYILNRSKEAVDEISSQRTREGNNIVHKMSSLSVNVCRNCNKNHSSPLSLAINTTTAP